MTYYSVLLLSCTFLSQSIFAINIKEPKDPVALELKGKPAYKKTLSATQRIVRRMQAKNQTIALGFCLPFSKEDTFQFVQGRSDQKFAPTTDNYILNQNASGQDGSFWIEGTGNINTSLHVGNGGVWGGTSIYSDGYVNALGYKFQGVAAINQSGWNDISFTFNNNLKAKFTPEAALLGLFGGVVGINTPFPGYTLDVNGNGRITNNLYITSESTFEPRLNIINSRSTALLGLNGYVVTGTSDGINAELTATGNTTSTSIVAGGIGGTSGWQVYQTNASLGNHIKTLEQDGSGNLFVYSIANAASNTNKFLVSEDGVLKYRTANQISADLNVWALGGNSGTTPEFQYIGTNDQQPLVFKTNHNEALRINAQGQISIGTNDAKGYKLAVNGDALFTKVKVKSFGAWPDYVFSTGYSLPTLVQVEAYIRKNGHLQDVPSAQQIDKEGIDVASMQEVLLEKVEELILYSIEQDKKIREQEAKIKELNNFKEEILKKMDLLLQKAPTSR